LRVICFEEESVNRAKTGAKLCKMEFLLDFPGLFKKIENFLNSALEKIWPKFHLIFVGWSHLTPKDPKTLTNAPVVI